MGSRLNSQFSTTIVGAFAGFPAEVVAVTSPPLTLAYDNQVVLIFWYVKYTTGVTGPVLSYNIRRGTLITSPLVNASGAGATEVASVNIARSGCMVDAVSIPGTPQYSLTMNVSNAATNGAFLEACILAVAL
jgi:hypothetical protein